MLETWKMGKTFAIRRKSVVTSLKCGRPARFPKIRLKKEALEAIFINFSCHVCRILQACCHILHEVHIQSASHD